MFDTSVSRRGIRHLLNGLLLSVSAMFAIPVAVGAQQFDIVGPTGSVEFGSQIAVLPNGNIVVTDPVFSVPGGAADVGAVYLYSPSGTPISTLTGSSSSDHIGSGPILVLTNGNFLVSSPEWNNGTASYAGAVTWINGTTGLSGTVSAANSLVGSSPGDTIGQVFFFDAYFFQIQPLRNGNYIIVSRQWDNGTIKDAGAVTWGNGSTGTAGVVSGQNSLIGTAPNDFQSSFVGELSNGNFVISNESWQNGSIVSAGAATWGNGSSGISGTISAANSLIGSATNDRIGFRAALTNGNFVAGSMLWRNGDAQDAGAITWGNGSSGTHGVVSADNSLVGSAGDDRIGFGGVTALRNGNYVVASPFWHNGANADVGAVTWASGSAGLSGPVSTANSLVGTLSGDHVGGLGTTALSNGDYVVNSPEWDNGAMANVGAATWANGSTGLVGSVSAANSLIGGSAGDGIAGWGSVAVGNGNFVVKSPDWNNGTNSGAGAATWRHAGSASVGVVSTANSLTGTAVGDSVGSRVVALSNGNYVVLSPLWHNGAFSNAGAVTWGSGSTGVSGPISPATSLIGSSQFDRVGSNGILELTNGNYVVPNPSWNNGPISSAGAVSWADGSVGISGTISASNSLVGTSEQEFTGVYLSSLSRGNYVVRNPYWDNGNNTNAGAVTWVDGRKGLSGTLSAANSLIGTSQNDNLGFEVFPTGNGNYVIAVPGWDNPALFNVGAVSFGRSNRGISGPIHAGNSLIGTEKNALVRYAIGYDATHDQVVIGRPTSNIVSLFKADQLFVDGLE